MNEKDKKTEKKEIGLIVLKELPKQEVRKFLDEDEKEIEVKTIEEAITELLITVREIKKAL